jgi:YggT family protein
MEFLAQFITIFFDLLIYAIIARILLSWFGGNRNGGFYRFIHEITEPILKTARKILPPIGMMDFSPILALIALDIIQSLLIKLIIGL